MKNLMKKTIVFTFLIFFVSCYSINPQNINYTQSEVSIKTNNPKTILSGTLLIPKGKGPFPAIILIAGSGPSDRDATFFKLKPFKTIAEYFANKGFAVLRCDDRGMGKSTGDYFNSTIYDSASDILYMVNYLQKLTKINKYKIGLLGHSEGCMVAAIAASKSPKIQFLIYLSPPGIPQEQIMLEAAKKIPESEEATMKFADSQEELMQKIYNVLKTNKNAKTATIAIEDLFKNDVKKFDKNEYKKSIFYFSDSIPVECVAGAITSKYGYSSYLANPIKY